MPNKDVKQKEVEIIKRILRKLIKSIPDVVEQDPGEFKRDKRKVWLSVKKNKVIVRPIGYWYTSIEQVRQEEFELKGVIDNYLKYGFKYPLLFFGEKSENDQHILYCTIEAAGIKTEFRPKWSELLDGVNRMVFTEYKNAKERKIICSIS